MKNDKIISMLGVNAEFWCNKRVLITGHTGFKGTWLSFWLIKMGAKVKGISLKPETEPNMYDEVITKNDLESIYGDIRDLNFLKKEVNEFNPEIIIHLAAQTIVRESYESPIDTLETNIMGTANVLEAAKSIDSLRAILCVTSDKCYENREWHWKYRENDAMGGHDPYSASKGCSELVIQSYRRSFYSLDTFNKHEVALASARAGNVIGGGDWATDRLIPDIMRSFSIDEPVVIRNPDAVRPWQHVLDVLRGYLMLTEKLYEEGQEFAEAWNIGPLTEDKAVRYIVNHLAEAWGNGASWDDDDNENPHEAFTLKLDSSKARSRIGWEPILSLNRGLELVVEWYKQFYSDGNNARAITENQITAFEEQCKSFTQKSISNKSTSAIISSIVLLAENFI
jgi:CDP-glucose 4,6-dehydratase